MPGNRSLLVAAVVCALPAVAPAADPVSFSVDGAITRPISPYIYGSNQANFKTQKYLALARWGGNRTTAYNWETNASNAGSDWQQQNDGYLSKSDSPAAPVLGLISAAHAANAAVIVTVPTIGYVAADKGNDGDVKKTPDYLTTRFVESIARKPERLSEKPDVTDRKVFQDEFVAFVERAFPESRTSASKTIFYALDNEPDLWSETHARIHPKKLTYAELVRNNIEYAAAIKAVAPKALVFGFASYGFAGFTTLQNAPDANNRNVLDFYLSSMAAAEKQIGKRLVDVVDLHWYPEARGGGVRITEDSSAPAVAAARIQAPRSLWDPTYTENSWITKDHTHAPIRLIPSVRERIDKHYPGTKLALAEYYYGGGDHISGALAEADALGIFAREGLFAAALWHVGNSKDTFIHAAMQMYLDYDGKGAAVGDTALAATTSDVERSSLYATKNAKGAVTLVAINRSGQAIAAEIELRNVANATSVTLYRLTSERPQPQPAGSTAIIGGRMKVELPALSVTTIAIGTP